MMSVDCDARMVVVDEVNVLIDSLYVEVGQNPTSHAAPLIFVVVDWDRILL